MIAMAQYSWSRAFFALTVLASICTAAAASSSPWSLEGAKLTIATIDGSARISESFSLDKAPSFGSVVDVSADEVLKLAFTLQGSDGEKLKSSEIPHQVVVSMNSGDSDAVSSSSIISVKASTGKASWNQRIDRLPLPLIGTDGEVEIRLLIASFGDVKPVDLPLMRIKLTDTAAATGKTGSGSSVRERQEARQGFRRHLERRHTFNIPAADQMPPRIVSLVAAAGVLFLPSAVFAILLSQIVPSLSFRSPSFSTGPFLASLFSIEGLALLYWWGNGFTLFKMMPWLAGIGLVSVFLGRSALSEMQRVRLGKQQ